ncbi:MAG: hypothetical protein AMXMBFR64_01010 [Myxococcales bacterium]
MPSARCLYWLGLALVVAGCEGDAVSPDSPPVPGDPGVEVGPGSASVKGVMTQGRVGATATVLGDGRIVIIGGFIPKKDADARAVAEGRPEAMETILDTVEIYDPATGQVTALASDPASPQTLYYPRTGHEALLFPDADRIAVFGGYTQVSGVTSVSSAVEVFRIAQSDFQAVGSMPGLSRPRVGHTASLLDYRNADGKGEVFALVAGGEGDARVSYEVWSPAGVKRVGSIAVGPRWNHRAVNVEGYYTFLVGGEDEDSTVGAIDVFDRETGAFLPNGKIPQSLALGGRVGHALAYDPVTRVVYVTGGYTNKARTALEPRIEVISTETGTGLAPPTANFRLDSARAYHQAATLVGGRVLVSGGLDAMGLAVSKTEVIGKTGGQVSAQAGVALFPARFGHRSIGMSEDTAILVGGATPLTAGGVALEAAVDVVHTP